MKHITLSFLLCLSICSQSRSQVSNAYIDVKSGTQYQLIKTYDLNKLNSILSQGLEEFLTSSTMKYADFKGSFPPAKYPVSLYRVKYRSVVPEFDNQPTIASGLVAVPETGLNSMPIVSYQHGTVFTKTGVPSFPDESSETQLMVARFASQGYIVIGADYFGKGLSDLPDSYLVKESTEQACVDMWFAATNVLADKMIKPGKLFIHGWSQGGWATLTLLRKLESLGITVTAATTASAPCDGYLLYDKWMNNYQSGDAVYIPACVVLQILAQEYYLRQDGLAALAIRPAYIEAVRSFYNNTIDYTTFSKLTKTTLPEILNTNFMSGGNLGNNLYWRTLETLQAYKWRSHTPMKNYYGESDEVVPVFIAKLPQDIHKLLGCGPTTAISAGQNADHRATYIYSVINAKTWFDDLLAAEH
ncbi:MAG: prolyl oligopeptidase family serine peptidase [Verrucomicrobiota bacterium]